MNYSKNQANEKIQTNTRKNRRLFQITQTRTQHETNTQIYTKISQKTVYLNVFLGSLIISRGFYSKTAIQQLSEN